MLYKLNYQRKLVSSEEERMFKVERLNILNKAIRSLRGNQNIGPLIDAISVMEREGTNIIAEYQTVHMKEDQQMIKT